MWKHLYPSLAIAALAVSIAACTSSTNTTSLPCNNDLNCPLSSYCGASGFCEVLTGSETVSIAKPNAVTVGKTEKLVATAQGGVTWSVMESAGGTIDADGTYHAPATPGTYHAIATSIADPTASATAAVVVVAAPPVPVISGPAMATRSSTGLTASVDAAAVQTGVTLSWTIQGGMITSSATGSSIVFSAGTGTSVVLGCTATNAAGDTASALPFTLSLNDAELQITGPMYVTSGKDGYTAQVQAASGATYMWTIEGGLITAGDGTNNIVFSAGINSNTLTLGVTVTNPSGGSGTGSLMIMVVDPVATPVIEGDTSVRSGQMGTAQLVGPQGGGVIFNWTLEGGSFIGGTSDTAATGASVSYTAGPAGIMVLNCSATSLSGDTASAAAFDVYSVGGASVTASQIVATPISAPADGTTPISVTVTINDANHAPIPGDALAIAVTPSTGVLPASFGSPTTDANGHYTFTFTSSKAEAKTITVTVDGVMLSTPVAFQGGVPVVAGSSLTVTPASVVANGTATTTLAVHLVDGSGNPTGGYPVGFGVTGGGPGGSANHVSANNCTTDATGNCSVTLSSTLAEMKSITAGVETGSANAFQLMGSVVFTAGDPNPGMSSFSGTQNILADGHATSMLTLTLKDAAGNLIGNFSSLSLMAGSTNNILNAQSSTNGSGVLTASLASIAAGIATVTATIQEPLAGTSFPLAATVNFLAGAPVLAKSSFSASPTTLPADGATPSVLMVTLADSNGNLVPGAQVQFYSSQTNTTLGGGGVATTNPSGIATAGITSKFAESASVSAVFGAGAFTFATMPSLTFTPGDASGVSTIVATPTASPPVVADGSSTVTLTLTARDAQGNPIPNLANVTISATGSNNTFSQASTQTPAGTTVTGTTNSSGVFQVTLATITAETKTITATLPRTLAGGTASPAPTTATFIAGAAVLAQSSLSSGTVTTAIADGNQMVTFTLTLRDAHDNLATAKVIGTPTGSDTTSDTVGAVSNPLPSTYLVNLSSIKADATKTLSWPITPGSGSAFNVVSNPVDFNAGAAVAGVGKSSVVPSTLSTTTDSPGNSVSVVSTFVDTNNNVLNGRPVTVSISGSGNTPASGTGTTSSGGTFTFAFASTHVQSETVSAAVTDFSGNVETFTSAAIKFTQGVASSTTSTFSAAPTSPLTSVNSDGTETYTLTLTVRDAGGNAVTGQAVSFAPNALHTVLNPVSSTTSASGVATATISSYVTQSVVVTATIGSASKNSPALNFGNPPWVPANAGQFGGSPNSLLVDPSNNHLLLSATGHFQNVYLSSNGGVSWTQPNGGLEGQEVGLLASANISPFSLIYAFAIPPSLTNYLTYSSTNSGANWEYVGSTGPGLTFNTVIVDPTDSSGKHLIAGNAYSANGGATWTTTNQLLASPSSIVYNPNSGATGFWAAVSILDGGSPAGIYKSADGVTWPQTPTATACTSNGNAPKLIAVADDPGYSDHSIFVGCNFDNEIDSSTNSGVSFAALPPSPAQSQLQAMIYDVANDTLYVSDSNEGLFSYTYYEQSSGSGYQWATAINENNGQGSIQFMAGYPPQAEGPSNAELLLAPDLAGFATFQPPPQIVNNGSVYPAAPVDGGVVSNSGLLAVEVGDVATDPRTDGGNSQIVYALEGHTAIKSTDSGLTWSPTTGLPAESDLRSLSLDGSGNAYLIQDRGQSTIYKLTATQSTWVETTQPEMANLSGLSTDRVSPNVAYVLGTELWRTDDAGLTWTAVTSSPTLLPIVAAKTVASMGNTTVVYGVNSAGNGVYRGTLSITPGSPPAYSIAWTQELVTGPNTSVASIDVAPDDPTGNTVAVSVVNFTASTYAVYYSTAAENGLSNPIATSFYPRLFFDPFNSGVLYATSGFTLEGVQKSVNGGVTWTSASDGLGNFGALANSLAFGPLQVAVDGGVEANGGTLIYAGTWDGVYKSDTSGQ